MKKKGYSGFEKVIIGLGAWTVGSYIWDVLVRPAKAAKDARKLADKIGKPLLNVGAGTPASSLRARILGPQLIGDVNVDIAAPRDVPHGKNAVSYADVQDLPFSNKEFGVAFTSHVLEHVDDPQKAMDELSRVAEHVINITPAWYAPHTWLYTDHQWYITKNGKFIPLWKRDNGRKAINATKSNLPSMRQRKVSDVAGCVLQRM